MPMHVLFWSATSKTKALSLRMADGFGSVFARRSLHNLTKRGIRGAAFSARDVVIAAAPVFSGRIPAPMREQLRLFSGNGARAIAVVTYGNRAYDDALLELSDLLTEQGFAVIAGGAFVAQHSIVPSVAHGRPDSDDLAELDTFAVRVLEKLKGGARTPPQLPGAVPYRAGDTNPQRIGITKQCNLCRLCAFECPMGAISLEPVFEIDITRCIQCMRCIHICPQEALALPAEALARIEARLAESACERRSSEFFL